MADEGGRKSRLRERSSRMRSRSSGPPKSTIGERELSSPSRKLLSRRMIRMTSSGLPASQWSTAQTQLAESGSASDSEPSSVTFEPDTFSSRSSSSSSATSSDSQTTRRRTTTAGELDAMHRPVIKDASVQRGSDGSAASEQEEQDVAALLLAQQQDYTNRRLQLVASFQASLMDLERQHHAACAQLLRRHGQQDREALLLRSLLQSPVLTVDKSSVRIRQQIAVQPRLFDCLVGDGFRCTVQIVDVESRLGHASERDVDELHRMESSLHEYARLASHPNIVSYLFHRYAEHASRPSLQLFTESFGPSLEQYLHTDSDRRRLLDLSVVHQIALDVAAGLAFLHKQGLAHRSLSPSSVFLEVDAATGLFHAGQRAAVGALLTAKQARLGQATTGFSFGPYTAPEQIINDASYESHHVDVDSYAFAMLLYLLLTGTPPYDGCSPVHILRNIHQGVALPLPCTEPDSDDDDKKQVHRQLCEIYTACSQLRAEQRPPMAMVAEALRTRGGSVVALQQQEMTRTVVRLQGQDIGGFTFAQRSGDVPLFEQFVVVGTAPDGRAASLSQRRSLRKPEVVYCYPEREVLDSHITELAFPSGMLAVYHDAYSTVVDSLLPSDADVRSPSNSFVVRISSDAGNYYGVCVRDVCWNELPLPWQHWASRHRPARARLATPSAGGGGGGGDDDDDDRLPIEQRHVTVAERCYVLLSRFPFFSLFFRLLYDVQQAVRARRCALPQCVAFLEQLHATAVPHQSTALSFTLPELLPGQHSYEIAAGHPSRHIANLALPVLFRTLSVDDLLTLWKLLLLEHKLIVLSSQPGLLSGLLYAAMPLLSPLVYQGVFLPLAPRHLQVLCDSPVPFLLGLCNAATLPRSVDRSEVAILDLDAKSFWVPPAAARLALPADVAHAALDFFVDSKNAFALSADADFVSSGGNASFNNSLCQDLCAKLRQLVLQLVEPIARHIDTADAAANFYRDFDRFDRIMAALQADRPDDYSFFNSLAQTQSFAFWLQTSLAVSLQRSE